MMRTFLTLKEEIVMAIKTASDVMKFAKDNKIEIVDLKFCDVPGLWQHFSVSANEFGEDVFEDGIGFDGSPVHPRFFIEPGTLNHFTPFRRFEKFGYSHLSAASFQANGIADFERHVPFPPVAARDARFAPRLPWPHRELTCHRSRGCIKAGTEILERLSANSAAGLIRQYARKTITTF
jgi:hypothetical protein